MGQFSGFIAIHVSASAGWWLDWNSKKASFTHAVPWCWQLGCLQNVSLQAMSQLLMLLYTMASLQQDSLDSLTREQKQKQPVVLRTPLSPPCSFSHSKSHDQSKFKGRGSKFHILMEEQHVACVYREGRNHHSCLQRLYHILWFPAYSSENVYFIIYFN